MIEQLVFYSLAAVTVGAALAVVLLRNVLHSALFLGLALAGVAGIFASLGADFLFASQLLVYVSGVAVLVVFVVMLAGRASELNLSQTNKQVPGALVVCGATYLGLRAFIRLFAERAASGTPAPTTHEIARRLLTDYALPFELISLILVVALVGAVMFTGQQPEEERP